MLTQRASIRSRTLAVVDNLAYLQVRYPDIATAYDWYMALARCSVSAASPVRVG